MKSSLDDNFFIENLEVIKIVGHGTFGLVYKCFNKVLQKKVALKKLFWNSSPLLIYNEIESLMIFTQNNCRNVLKFINLYRYKDMVFIEMEYHHHQSISTFLYKMTNDDIYQYMKDLLTALCDIHALGYIHRDVKPGNFLYDIKKKKGILCDFGLCEKQIKEPLCKLKNIKESKINLRKNDDDDNDDIYNDSNKFDFNFEYLEKDIKIKSNFDDYENDYQAEYKIIKQDSQGCTIHFDIPINDNNIKRTKFKEVNDNKNNFQGSSLFDYDYDIDSDVAEIDMRETMQAKRGGTRGYRAPEVLWKMKNQTTAIDVWSAGIIFLTLLSRRNPFLSGKDDITDLYEISCIVGRQKIQLEALMCGRFLALPDNKQKEFTLKEIVEKLNPCIHDMNIPESAFDLLTKMLDPSPFKRISAKKCLQHPYFSLS